MSEFLHTFHNGHTTKCEYIKPLASKTQSFTLVYAHGFCSDPYGRKPEEIKKWCLEHGMGFFRTVLAIEQTVFSLHLNNKNKRVYFVLSSVCIIFK